MSFQLTQKEEYLLKDQLSHEKVCIEKYSNCAQQAQDPQLKQLFSQYASQEQQHCNTVNQLLRGQQVNVVGGQAQQQNQQAEQNMPQQGQQPGGEQARAGMTNQQYASHCSTSRKESSITARGSSTT